MPFQVAIPLAAAALGGLLGRGNKQSLNVSPSFNAQQLGLANKGTTQGLRNLITPDTQRLKDFQNAFLAEKSPLLEERLNRERAALDARIGASGTSGSSGSQFSQFLNQRGAERDRGALENQAIQVREQLSNNALQQELARLNAFTGIQRSDFNEKSGLGRARNELGQQNLASTLLGGIGGFNIGKTLLPGLLNAFGGGGGGGVNNPTFSPGQVDFFNSAPIRS